MTLCWWVCVGGFALVARGENRKWVGLPGTELFVARGRWNSDGWAAQGADNGGESLGARIVFAWMIRARVPMTPCTDLVLAVVARPGRCG